MNDDLTPLQAEVFGVIEKAIEAGEHAPSNPEIAARMVGDVPVERVGGVLGALRVKGLIDIQRFGGFRGDRAFILCSTGETTALPDAEVLRRAKEIDNAFERPSPCFRCGSRMDACGCNGGNV